MRSEGEMIEAMKQALEALEAGDWYISQLEPFVYSADEEGTHEERSKVQLAIAALRAAIASATINETETVEPVAWMYTPQYDGDRRFITRYQFDLSTYTSEKVCPLYTHPPRREWVGLTDEGVRQAAQAMDAEPLADGWKELVKFARAIEAKLKEKNT